LFLGSDAVWEKLRHRADPHAFTPPTALRRLPLLCGLDEPRHGAGVNLRAHLLHELGRLRTDVRVVIDRLEREGNLSARRALILSLGEFTSEQVPPRERDQVTDLLLGWYETDPDPGVHSAIAWLLGQGRQGPLPRKLDWGQAAALRKIDRALGARMAVEKSRRLSYVFWSVTSDGEHTLSHILRSGMDFRYGSPRDERWHDPATEPVHTRRIDRRFAIATKEVTVAQFERFLDAARPDLKEAFRVPAGQDRDRPVTGVPLLLAAEYCNWLTMQEWKDAKELCFVVDWPTGVRLHPDYLRRRGYRLPTTAEWEFACRAGEMTSRFYGTSDTLLAQYAWHGQSSRGQTWPVGQLKPNDLGLFDLYGNVAEWCLNPAFQVLKQEGKGWTNDGPIDAKLVRPGELWVVRGGAFNDAPRRLRSAAWTSQPSEIGSPFIGFRVARTVVDLTPAPKR
jgi:formylglycine-generating enzyme required for sulfatase activity